MIKLKLGAGPVVKEMEIAECLRDTISKWSIAVEHHSSGRYIDALETYGEVSDISARMYYNLACAYMKLDSTEHAIECLSHAIQKDEHLAIAFFQRGTLYLNSGSIDESLNDLETARTLLRGNPYIDYKPLGLYVSLNRYQILHNMALALSSAKRVPEAREVLTEAFHDVDSIQRKNLQTSLEKINDDRPDLVPAMIISADKVFTPPKHVTKNLEKKDIMRKARVISATNTEDRSTTFDGSRRVRELKELPKPQNSPFGAVKRFVTNAPPRNRSTSDMDKLNAQCRMKKSKSMSDLVVSDYSHKMNGSKSPFLRIKRIFQKKGSKSWEGETNSDLKPNHSFGNLEKQLSPPVMNSGKTSPRSPLGGVRKLLNIKKKRQSREPSLDEEMPVLVMRGSGSTGDLSQLEKSFYRSKSEENSPRSSEMRNRIASDLYEKLNLDASRRKSLGTLFGGYLTVAQHGLSLSCDVLTAIVTPTDDENDLLCDETEDNSFKFNYENIALENNRNQPVQMYVNITLSNDTIETRSSLPSMETQSPNDSASKCKETIAKKPRPPPPSYPPPPLPQNIESKT